MLGIEKITTKHDEIKKWVEEHGGRPAIIGSLELNINSVGLQLNFHGKQDKEYLGESVPLIYVNWEKFFEIFDKKNLALMYEERKDYFDISMSYRFINRNYAISN